VKIPFVKASACGNDFLIVEESACTAAQRHEITRRLCHRTKGVGADGVEWIAADSAEYDIRATLINADGSDAEISGNGTRCVAATFAASRDGGDRPIAIATGAGVKKCELTGISGESYAFATLIGRSGQVGGSETLHVGENQARGIFVDLGNPHFVITVEALPDDWRQLARSIQALSHRFAHGVNVEFAHVESPSRVRAWFYERGAGETSSSGTGSCAVACACRADGLTGDVVEVVAPGGAQTVEFRGEQIVLRGTAEIICRGEAYL